MPATRSSSPRAGDADHGRPDLRRPHADRHRNELQPGRRVRQHRRDAASLGFGWTLDYDIAFLPFDGPQKRLVLPGNNRVNFVDDGAGNYKPFDDPRFDGAVIRATNLAANEWELTFRDGRVGASSRSPRFQRGGPPTFVTEMVDPHGNVAADPPPAERAHHRRSARPSAA